jgi:preprotein translocase subunit SecD
VIISLFSSLFITRTLLALLLEWFKPEQRAYGRWFGL